MEIPSAKDFRERRRRENEEAFETHLKMIRGDIAKDLASGLLAGSRRYMKLDQDKPRLTAAVREILEHQGYVNVHVKWEATNDDSRYYDPNSVLFFYEMALPPEGPPPSPKEDLSPPPYQVRPPKSKRQWCWLQ